MKTLLRLYSLTEAAERMISQADAERRWPESTVYFDRDVGRDHSRATFFVSTETEPNSGDDAEFLVANTMGGGWWRWDQGRSHPAYDEKPRWTRITKPSKERAHIHQHDQENVGEEFAEKMFPGSIKAFRDAGFDPEDCSFDMWNGMLAARMWDLNHTAMWNKRSKKWDHLPEIDQEHDNAGGVGGQWGQGDDD